MKTKISGLLSYTVCFALAVITGNQSIAQDLQLVRKKFYGYTEVYHVLKSDKRVRHGSYELISKYGKHVIGLYDKGTRTGRWVGMPEKEPKVVYNYTSKKLEYYEPAFILSIHLPDPVQPGDVITSSGTVYPIMAFFQGNLNALIGYKLPTGTFKYDIQIHINEDGLVTSAEIVSNGGKGKFRKEIRIESFKNEFFPATVNGSGVKSILIIDIDNYLPRIQVD